MADSFLNIKDFQNAINYIEIYLKIVREVGDRGIEANEYCSLGNAYHSLGNFQKAIDYLERNLKISRELGQRAGEGIANGNLGDAYHSVGEFQKAVQYYKNSVIAFDHIRGNLLSNDEWKISLGNTYDRIISRVWEL